MIDVDSIQVTLGGQAILDDISFCIHPGEFIGIIGPNGAGKTTLLRCLLNLQEPNSGTVTRGKGVTIGYVPQQSLRQSNPVPMSVLEIVMLGSAGDTARAKRALNEVSMTSYAKHRFAQLSGGQQQRVLIAKALASSPAVLFLDEPTTGIDELSQSDFYDTINELNNKGIAIVMVSHDIDVVLRQVGRVLLLNQSIRYDGTPNNFKIEDYLPSFYSAQHRLLHHHHRGETHA